MPILFKRFRLNVKALLLTCLCINLLTACNNQKRLPATGGKELSTAAQHIQQIYVATSPCNGTCPVFKMTVNADRTAAYEAIANNKKQGLFRATLSNRDYEKLVQLLERTGFEQLPERFTRPVTDLPAVTLKIVYDKGKTKAIYDYGLQGTKALEDFYGFVFSLADGQEWQ